MVADGVAETAGGHPPVFRPSDPVRSCLAGQVGSGGDNVEAVALSDLELVRRMVAGDAAALAENYRRHQRLASSCAFRVLRDRALSEDAVQEAFFDLWRDAAKFDPAQA